MDIDISIDIDVDISNRLSRPWLPRHVLVPEGHMSR